MATISSSFPTYDHVLASDNVNLPITSLAKTLTYNGDNNVTSSTVVYNGSTYVQTLTYTGANLTSISGWVKQ